MRHSLRALLGVLLLGLSACSAGATGARPLTVLASWEGAEQQAFEAVLAEFERETGIEVAYRGTRSVSQVLRSDVQKGRPPDVAVLPNPGELARYVDSGDLRNIDGVLGEEPGEQWLPLQRLGTPSYYTVVVKADLKSLIWYRPGTLPGPPPRTWADLVALSGDLTARGRTPWCLGMESQSTSGWPGTDWIEDILLRRSGPEVYQRFAAGELPWTSTQVRQAWEDWGQLVAQPGAVRGGTNGALLLPFGDAAKPMFTTPPGCALDHFASSRISGYQQYELPGGAKPAVADFDFFPFPVVDATAEPAAQPAGVSADLAGMFVESAEAKALMRYLASERGQAVWPSRETSATFSINRNLLPQGVYRDPLSVRVAERLTSGPWCFDASDMMPATMSDAFQRAVLDYLGNPSGLERVLEALERVRAGIPADERLNLPCGR
ncbi:ABC transporter substrate-binding protein [Amycolatopsis sp. YIM 10]|uniref:ABC transporter substrate-binding protein n=1 Tax=Amycolatopsis sp. YIM 10 TaxID=2653857 RepID=UPI00128FCE0D|nr:extracellular solute-binding protein [Amycolatopsis sp. YIM 10]QFU90908.1 putative sugar-binding periplasmic protein precursor [Amycolatopsis sp. YIM 10]